VAVVVAVQPVAVVVAVQPVAVVVAVQPVAVVVVDSPVAVVVVDSPVAVAVVDDQCSNFCKRVSVRTDIQRRHTSNNLRPGKMDHNCPRAGVRTSCCC